MAASSLELTVAKNGFRTAPGADGNGIAIDIPQPVAHVIRRMTLLARRNSSSVGSRVMIGLLIQCRPWSEKVERRGAPAHDDSNGGHPRQIVVVQPLLILCGGAVRCCDQRSDGARRRFSAPFRHSTPISIAQAVRRQRMLGRQLHQVFQRGQHRLAESLQRASSSQSDRE